jgi:hypothetical protein
VVSVQWSVVSEFSFGTHVTLCLRLSAKPQHLRERYLRAMPVFARIASTPGKLHPTAHQLFCSANSRSPTQGFQNIRGSRS